VRVKRVRRSEALVDSLVKPWRPEPLNWKKFRGSRRGTCDHPTLPSTLCCAVGSRDEENTTNDCLKSWSCLKVVRFLLDAPCLCRHCDSLRPSTQLTFEHQAVNSSSANMRLPYTDNPPKFENEDDKAILERAKARRGEMGLFQLDTTLLHAPKIADGMSPHLLATLSNRLRLELLPRRNPHQEFTPSGHSRNSHMSTSTHQQSLV
jgi:hypothetical protein